ncbi:MAG: response regulator transcription factor [Rhodocyclaceae bacterium]|nr:response regulator transcription factor [Rhodocyclaceae bacterium]
MELPLRNAPIKVLFADDHRLLAAGVQHALRGSPVDVVEVVFSLDGLIDRYLRIRPDVFVTDVRFNSRSSATNGLDACEEILAADPSAKIVVFSQFDDQYIVEQAYRLGALAFVLKEESTEILELAIATVADGREYFSPQVAQLLARSSVKERSPRKLLDDRELQAFLLMADGASLADTAEKLDLSTKTVGTMLKVIRSKLDIDTTADFTKLAIRFGLTTTEVKPKS